MKKINLFNRNTNLPSYRRMPVSRGFNRGGGIPFPWERGPAEQPGGMGITPSPFGATPSWKEGERSGRGGLWFTALIALFIATPSFATPTELDKKTVASKAYVDTKQDIIPTSLVQIPDYGGEVANQSLVTYDTTNGIVGNEIGIVTQQLVEELGENNIFALEGSDNLVPTVDAVLNAISSGANMALPTGTPGTVVIYNGTNIETSVPEFGERAVYDPANTYNAQTDATKLATAGFVETKQNKMVCAGWDSDTHTDEHCWLWSIE